VLCSRLFVCVAANKSDTSSHAQLGTQTIQIRYVPSQYCRYRGTSSQGLVCGKVWERRLTGMILSEQEKERTEPNCVGVMKDEELKIEEIEPSHTLG
jgi:hypothetical protein